MAQTFALKAASRSASPKAVRRLGRIPGILYGHGIKPQNVEVDAREFNKVFSQAGSTSLVTLSITDGEKHPVLVREIQQHPLKEHVTHVDYYRVRMDEALRAQVPLRFVGESPAVKNLSGVLVRNMDEIELEALPQDLPHDIEIDISLLTTFDSLIRVADLKLPKEVKVMQEGDAVIALVQRPRTEEELASLATEVKEDVEAVEGVKKEEPVAEGEEPKGKEGKPEEAKKEKKE